MAQGSESKVILLASKALERTKELLECEELLDTALHQFSEGAEVSVISATVLKARIKLARVMAKENI